MNQVLGERGAELGYEFQKAENIVRKCKICGGTGVNKKSIVNRMGHLAKEITQRRDPDELEEERSQKQKRLALKYSKEKKENPENSSYGSCECRIEANSSAFGL